MFLVCFFSYSYSFLYDSKEHNMPLRSHSHSPVGRYSLQCPSGHLDIYQHTSICQAGTTADNIIALLLRLPIIRVSAIKTTTKIEIWYKVILVQRLDGVGFWVIV